MKKTISPQIMKILTLIPSANVAVIPIWYYNLAVQRAAHMDYLRPWLLGILAASPWIMMNMLGSHYFAESFLYWDVVSYVLLYIGTMVMGQVLTSSFEKRNK